MQIGFIFLAAALLTCFPVSAQVANVSGSVTDEQGAPLVGVTVVEKGTVNGTVTGVEGNYQLTLQTDNPVLIFSFVGMATREVAVNNQPELDVTMTEDIASLEELVVIGYGTEKRANLSGAVDQVDAEQLARRPISSVTEGLQGVVPNLNIDNSSGAPGTTPNINIRGLTSINGGNPLVLIDGIPSDPVELVRIAPQDVESISIIKDASAAAIYGARAAFGVILLTTKSGQDGFNIDYTGYTSFNRPTVLPNKVSDPYIYLRWRETSTDNTPWDNQNYSDQTYQYAIDRSNDPSIPGVRVNPADESTWEYMGNRDWTNYFLEDYTVSNNHQLAISGATDKVDYYLSGSYSRENGVITVADDYFDRFTVRSKINFRPVNWFQIGNNTAIATTERVTSSYFTSLSNSSFFDMRTIYDLHPTGWNRNPDGSFANSGPGRVEAQLTNGGQDVNAFTSIQSQFTTQLNLFRDIISLNTDFTLRRGRNDRNWFQNQYAIGFGPDDIRNEGNNSAYRASTVENYYVLNAYLKYSQQFNNHGVSVTAGFNQEQYEWNQFSAQRNELISASLPSIALATGDEFVDEQITEWAVRGAFYRLNYNYAGKYILELNGRYDGSSKFPAENRFGFFPSASAAWRVDKEGFMQGLGDIVSLAKIRASVGSLGNQSIGAYEYIASMNASQGDYLIGGNLPLQVSSPQLVSPNFTWEEVVTQNLGADFGFFGDKITASFDLYNRATKGMLTLGRELPDVLGATEPKENAADLETKGWEVALNFQQDFMVAGKPMFVSAGFNMADSRSYITRFDNPNGSLTQYREGMELGEIWGLTNNGFFRSEDEIEALDQTAIIPWGALSIVEGWPKYVDQDGNGAIEKGLTVDDPKDLSIIGNQSPRYRYGFNFAVNWNGFDISALFQGVGRRDFYPLDYLYWGFYQQPYAGGYPHLLDYYRAEAETGADRDRHSQSYIDAGLADQNLDATYPHLQAWLADRNLGERVDEAQGMAIPQTDYLLNAAYLRVKNLTVGYSLPLQLVEKIGLNNVRFYLSGENLFEWSDVKDFFDPESINDSVEYNPAVNRSRNRGKGYTYPFQRRYVVGLNIGL